MSVVQSVKQPLTIIPYLCVDKSKAAVKFYQEAFGAKVVAEYDLTPPDPDRLMHATIEIMGQQLYLSDAFTPDACTPDQSNEKTYCNVSMRFEDLEVLDKMYAQAVKAGAKGETEPHDAFWGDRYASLRCPFGHRFSLMGDLPADRAKAAAEAYKAAAATEGEPEQKKPKSDEK